MVRGSRLLRDGRCLTGSIGSTLGWPIFMILDIIVDFVLGRTIRRMEGGESHGVALQLDRNRRSCSWQLRSSPQATEHSLVLKNRIEVNLSFQISDHDKGLSK